MTATPAPSAPSAAQRAVSDYSLLLGHIRSAGLLRRARGFYLTRLCGLLLAIAGIGVGIVLLGDTWVQLAVAVAMAFIVTQVMFFSHDAAHRQIFGSHKANEWAALLLGTGIGGVSLGWWNTKHTRHHQAPNQIAKDPDIAPGVLNFYPSEERSGSRLVAFVRDHQGWWFYPILIFEALNLHAQSVYTVITRKNLKHRWWEAALLTIRLVVFPVALFIFLPWPMALAFLGVQLAGTGLYLGSAFAVSHIGMPIVPKDAKIDFLSRQVLMSRNISGGHIASFAMGGLNYQIEHHLFPGMARPYLRRARPLVREFCAERSIEYNEVHVFKAWSIVAQYLNRVGIAAGVSAVACPTAATLRY